MKNIITIEYRDVWTDFSIGIWQNSLANLSLENVKYPQERIDYAKSYSIDVRTGDFLIQQRPYIQSQWSYRNKNNCTYPIKSGDNISMILNMNELSLTFKKTSDDALIKFVEKIDCDSYSAGIVIGHSSYSVKLVQSGYI